MHIVSILLYTATQFAPAALGSTAATHPVGASASYERFVAAGDTGTTKLQKKRKKPAVPRSQKQTKSEQSPASDVPAPAKLPDPPPLPTKYRGVALFPLEVSEVDPALQQTIEQTLLNEIDEIAGLQSISPQDVQTELANNGLSVGACDRDLSCLVRAGRYSRAHMAIEARVSALGGVPTLALRLIDTVAGKELARAAEALSGDERGMLLQLHRLAVQLLTPEAYVGSLSISCPLAGAEVYLDDKLLGTTPLGSQQNLPAGLHVLRLSKPGYSDINRFVDVVYNRASTVQADFNNTEVAGVVVEQVSASGFGELNVITEEAGLEIRVDGEPVGVTPLHGSITKIGAGKRRISIRKAGQQPVFQEIDVKAGLRTDAVLKTTDHGVELSTLQLVPPSTPLPTVDDVLHPKPPPPPPAPPQGLSWRLYAGIGGMAAGALCLGGAALFAHQVASDNSQAKAIAHDPNQATWDLDTRAAKQAELLKLNADGPSSEVREWIFLGAGGGLLIAGGAFIIWDVVRAGQPGPQPPTPAAAPTTGLDLHLAPLWGHRLVGASLSGRF